MALTALTPMPRRISLRACLLVCVAFSCGCLASTCGRTSSNRALALALAPTRRLLGDSASAAGLEHTPPQPSTSARLSRRRLLISLPVRVGRYGGIHAQLQPHRHSLLRAPPVMAMITNASHTQVVQEGQTTHNGSQTAPSPPENGSITETSQQRRRPKALPHEGAAAAAIILFAAEVDSRVGVAAVAGHHHADAAGRAAAPAAPFPAAAAARRRAARAVTTGLLQHKQQQGQRRH